MRRSLLRGGRGSWGIHISLVLCALLATRQAAAVEVTGSGSGATPDMALFRAKLDALGNAAGVFVSSKKDVAPIAGRVNETVVEYSGGVIRAWSIVDQGRTGELFTVTIRADVDNQKHNEVLESKGRDVPQDVKDALTFSRKTDEEVAAAFEGIDRIVDPMAVEVSATTYENVGSDIVAHVNLTLRWNPKWVSDVWTLASKVGDAKSIPDPGRYVLCMSNRASAVACRDIRIAPANVIDRPWGVRVEFQGAGVVKVVPALDSISALFQANDGVWDAERVLMRGRSSSDPRRFKELASWCSQIGGGCEFKNTVVWIVADGVAHARLNVRLTQAQMAAVSQITAAIQTTEFEAARDQ